MVVRRVHIVTFLVIVSLSSVGCPGGGEKPSPSTSTAATNSLCVTGASLDLDCAAFPNTDPTAQPTWDYFAWNTFIAANWPAVVPAQPSYQRGIPDLSKSFVDAAPDELLTWETYKEKREVFFAPSGNSMNPGMWNQPVKYGSMKAQIPPCPGAASSGPPSRVFLQGGKMPLTAYDSLDETVEVPSPALESSEFLCGPGVQCGGPNAPDCCRVTNLPVTPRVWKGKPLDPGPNPPRGRPVLYEVKVNYDFFQYVMANSLYIDQTASNQASQGEITLPYRTSAAAQPARNQSLGTATDTSATAPPPPNNANAVFGYNAAAAMQGYQNVTPTSNLTPAPSGAIQLKAAWILLDGDDPSRFHTTTAAYFKTDQNKQTCMATGTFGLVGLHIIQRIHQGTGPTASPTGGTFVFATWEHVGNEEAGFSYSNYYGGKTTPPAHGFYPSLSNPLPVRRRFPILEGTRKVNEQVHAAIRARNPNSVWLNYQLIGTQFQAMSVLPPGSGIANQNDPTGIGQPLFLANIVIETNIGLQHFQGLPPTEMPVAQFAKHGITGNPLNSFAANTPNVTFNGKAYNMGGCMGCHGVAQIKGYSFSFVLLLGQRGAAIETESHHPDPAEPPPPQMTATGT